jgi:transcription initiation factor TFIID TATA-box-binding protein|tara:strand:- start:1341 stop:1991 length:651 start_codon:yes stop_codon:yes gene_type:complete
MPFINKTLYGGIKIAKSKISKSKTTRSVKKPTKKAKRDVKLQNIVATTTLWQDIPLIKLAETLPNTEYNPEQFPGLVMRIKEPKTSALIFSSGKVVCTGAKSMLKVKDSIRAIIKNIEKISIRIKVDKVLKEIKVQNMVASGSIGMDLNLNSLAMTLENTEYEPEQFPGLVFKLSGTNATFLLFSNGKIVCTGTKSEKKLHEAVDKLVIHLKKHIK